MRHRTRADDTLRAGFEFYRAFASNLRFNRSRKERIDVPITLVGGEHSAAASNAVIAKNLRAYGALHVTTETIAGSGHYVVKERPQAVATSIRTVRSGAIRLTREAQATQ
jgi:pimeloyl-ACP methyl ester carboxylesterase